MSDLTDFFPRSADDTDTSDGAAPAAASKKRTTKSQIENASPNNTDNTSQDASGRGKKRRKINVGTFEDDAPPCNDTVHVGILKKDQLPWESLPVEECLKKLCLRRILKENHGGDIQDIRANRTFGNRNLIATVGKDQAHIYDNEHLKKKDLDLFLHFINQPTPDNGPADADRDLVCCQWLAGPNGDQDTYLAVAGKDTMIHVVSVAHTAVKVLLKGHNAVVNDLAAHPTNSSWLFSLSSEDGSVRMWDIETGRCLCVIKTTTADSFAVRPDGDAVFIGAAKGGIEEWELPSDDQLDEVLEAKAPTRPIVLRECKREHNHHSSWRVDCIRAVSPTLVISKSIDGRIASWNPQEHPSLMAGETAIKPRRIKVKGSKGCRFDLTEDGQFLCVGDDEGAVHVWNVQTGSAINNLTCRRSRWPVTACCFGRGGRTVLLVSNSIVWRYEYFIPIVHQKEEEKEEEKEGEEEEGEEESNGKSQ
eukprot:TRINITY_DN3928_c1_g1_i2.p1 TRINITY_DN3928_c1_g1~~TRINITY_DN3928_c1_g1_i2.p1  ORF type:complete len:477 (+),score=141.99 TRINITY_DN3928_c1_g1_i2:115-1545(+)